MISVSIWFYVSLEGGSNWDLVYKFASASGATVFLTGSSSFRLLKVYKEGWWFWIYLNIRDWVMIVNISSHDGLLVSSTVKQRSKK